MSRPPQRSAHPTPAPGNPAHRKERAPPAPLAGPFLPGWKYVNVRRTLLFRERSLDSGTQWVVFEPNGAPLTGVEGRDSPG